MQFSTVAIISALAAAVSANGNYSTTVSAVWVTDVVTSFTTVCPAATTLSYNGVTYTATKNETITITNCPSLPSVPTTAPVASGPVYGNSTAAPAPTAPATSKGGSVGTTAPAGSSPSASTTAPLTVANNGNRAMALSGVSLAGLLGVAAYLL
ncbi:hypothetical protein DID88_001012 [Monilinia fructigena]|uniref:Phytocyanin domain-containing protein n=1 Tax=Monilinia fructigena TaxID=38457 RepID=A0A395IYW8_9HELO|nr:hypothetical protein DID88_001012 [Monilinia fructigena]